VVAVRALPLPAAVAAVLLWAGSAAALQLPTPAEQRAQDRALLQEVGARADRVLVSVVPGPVVNDELVLVGLAGGGAPQEVTVEQRLALSGTGDYQVRERGPARASEALGDEPAPVTKFGAVVWQGFSPGSRVLAARLTLDPDLEAARLPLQVTASHGGSPLGPGGQVPGPGTVLLTLTNVTHQPAALPTAADADAAQVAAALDAARAAAGAPAGPRLPAAGAGLPEAVPAEGEARVSAVTGVPLRIMGGLRLRAPDGSPRDGLGSVSGPATTPTQEGAEVTGTLPPGATAELRVDVTGPARLEVDLTAVPALDPRVLVPPQAAASWAAWAAAGPDAEARRAALDLLVQTAATGARATSYSPYLGADLPGTGSTTFRYSFAEPEQAEQAEQVTLALTPRPGALAVTAVALLLLAANGVLLWRRS
jgi:hypothetical protein